MRILVVSDTHGRHKGLETAIKRTGPCDYLFHLGDVTGYEDVISSMVDYPTVMIGGNNDFGMQLKRETVLELSGHRFFLTHGHKYGVSLGTDKLKKRAKELSADVVLFGHTHLPYNRTEDGILFLNPGSISLPRQFDRVPTYAVLELDSKGEIHVFQVQLEKK